MDMLQRLTKQLSDPDTLSKLGKSIHATPDQVHRVATKAMPTLLSALQRNAGTADGASSLAKALEQHQDDGVDDIDGFLENVDTKDGAKMLTHILGGGEKKVEKLMAKQTGLDATQISGLLAQFAPLLIGMLGKAKKEEGVDESGVSGMLGNLVSQGQGNGLLDMAGNLLGSDSSGGIGSLLGGLFKKK